VAENVHGRVEATSHLYIVSEKQKPERFAHVSVSPARSIEPDTSFVVECNATNVMIGEKDGDGTASSDSVGGGSLNKVLWYQNNRPVVVDGKKFTTNMSKINAGK
jgi:hypothetical protein